ncbi:hypothetical protein V5H98_18140 [Georgenia sp. M64]|uniref:hypothetical protein n=1 Tax=Georgenia sp. M64 TaxID=3120520 RepID=UPI0030E175EB
MAQPFQPNLHPADEDGIPAADPGTGAPETAPGFGVEGETPRVPADTEEPEDADSAGGTGAPGAADAATDEPRTPGV